MGSAEQKLVDTRRQQLTDTREMIARLELHDAVLNLNYLANQNHPSLEEIRTTAQQLLPQIKAQRERYAQQAAEHLERAETLLKEFRFAETIAELNQIPAPLRDRSAQQLLEQAVATCTEIDQLRQRLLQPKGIPLSDRQAAIERLLELQPHDPQTHRWAQGIHDHLLQIASKKVKTRCYQESIALLRSIPTTTQSDASRKLQRQVEELEYLQAELQLAPTATAITLEAAKRLVRIDQGNEAAQVALQELTRRLQVPRNGSDAPSSEWTACPQQTHIGLPVPARHAPQRLRFATPEMQARFEQHPAQFFVAAGMALQAIGRAAVPVNLLRSTKQGVMGLLRSSFRERPVRSGWGLDLSNTGLKAIQLTVTDDDQVHVTQCIHITHRLRLTHPDAATAERSILLESLANFTSQCSWEPTDRVVTQWPTMQSLIRHLIIPPADDKKLTGLIEREAQFQIPFPLSEVRWDTFRFPTHNSNATDKRMHVLLVAIRQDDLEKRLAILKEGGIDVHAVQCDAVALHNFLHFDLLNQASPAKKTASGAQPTGVAALDVGSDATGMVFSFPDFVWFRAFGHAGDDVTARLACRFNITSDIAEQVKCDPTKAKRMSDVNNESTAVFRQIVGQFESAMSDFKALAPKKCIEQLLVTGGGGQTHGLLRFLRFGR